MDVDIPLLEDHPVSRFTASVIQAKVQGNVVSSNNIVVGSSTSLQKILLTCAAAMKDAGHWSGYRNSLGGGNQKKCIKQCKGNGLLQE